MKIFLKWAFLCVIGFLVSLILYPLLHELGHYLSAYILGATDIKIELFPFANTFCNVGALNKNYIAIIAISGSVFPCVVSICITPKNFLLFYTNSVLKIISTLALIVGVFEIFFHDKNILSDELIAIQAMSGIEYFLIILYIFATICMILSLKNSCFISKTDRFFS